MKIECSWTRKDLKKYLYQKRKVPNLIFLGLGIFTYFFATYYAFQDRLCDNKVLILGFFICLLILLILLWGVTHLYVFCKLRRNDKKTHKAYGTYQIEVDKEKITSTFAEEKISYLWKDVTTAKFHKNSFYLRTKEDKLGLVFHREILKEDYDALQKYVKKHLPS